MATPATRSLAAHPPVIACRTHTIRPPVAHAWLSPANALKGLLVYRRRLSHGNESACVLAVHRRPQRSKEPLKVGSGLGYTTIPFSQGGVHGQDSES
jgi:hypothetical protein